ncbi:uncharacterized protein LOC122798626 [Protopterus annectens]|uniref:uncharacterized protein LOC122798626 n=1 Tax=Protopterus annectens TaxID=7888 RepID=UPI001CFC42B7|nr:uncharacterized protein LOC122798626 [Protopterus annectens]
MATAATHRNCQKEMTDKVTAKLSYNGQPGAYEEQTCSVDTDHLQVSHVDREPKYSIMMDSLMFSYQGNGVASLPLSRPDIAGNCSVPTMTTVTVQCDSIGVMPTSPKRIPVISNFMVSKPALQSPEPVIFNEDAKRQKHKSSFFQYEMLKKIRRSIANALCCLIPQESCKEMHLVDACMMKDPLEIDHMQIGYAKTIPLESVPDPIPQKMPHEQKEYALKIRCREEECSASCTAVASSQSSLQQAENVSKTSASEPPSVPYKDHEFTDYLPRGLVLRRIPGYLDLTRLFTSEDSEATEDEYKERPHQTCMEQEPTVYIPRGGVLRRIPGHLAIPRWLTLEKDEATESSNEELSYQTGMEQGPKDYIPWGCALQRMHGHIDLPRFSPLEESEAKEENYEESIYGFAPAKQMNMHCIQTVEMNEASFVEATAHATEQCAVEEATTGSNLPAAVKHNNNNQSNCYENEKCIVNDSEDPASLVVSEPSIIVIYRRSDSPDEEGTCNDYSEDLVSSTITSKYYYSILTNPPIPFTNPPVEISGILGSRPDIPDKDYQKETCSVDKREGTETPVSTVKCYYRISPDHPIPFSLHPVEISVLPEHRPDKTYEEETYTVTDNEDPALDVVREPSITNVYKDRLLIDYPVFSVQHEDIYTLSGAVIQNIWPTISSPSDQYRAVTVTSSPTERIPSIPKLTVNAHVLQPAESGLSNEGINRWQRLSYFFHSELLQRIRRSFVLAISYLIPCMPCKKKKAADACMTNCPSQTDHVQLEHAKVTPVESVATPYMTVSQEMLHDQMDYVVKKIECSASGIEADSSQSSLQQIVNVSKILANESPSAPYVATQYQSAETCATKFHQISSLTDTVPKATQSYACTSHKTLYKLPKDSSLHCVQALGDSCQNLPTSQICSYMPAKQTDQLSSHTGPLKNDYRE